MGWRSKAEKAKKGHRPSLKDWSCDQLYKTFPSYKQEVLSKANFGYDECIPFPNQTKKRSYHYSTIASSSSPNRNSSSTRTTNDDIGGHSSESFAPILGSVIPARIDAKITSPSEFHSKYEAKLVPTVITNIPQGFDVPPPPPSNDTRSSNPLSNPKKTLHAWKALDTWDLDSLATHDELRERLFKCGEDDDGKSIKLKLKHFLRYLENNNDGK